jgi:hypothetical protein
MVLRHSSSSSQTGGIYPVQLPSITHRKKRALQKLREVRRTLKNPRRTQAHEPSTADQLRKPFPLLVPAPDLLPHQDEEV